jgi:ABC-type taurine transport system ATPase subunit
VRIVRAKQSGCWNWCRSRTVPSTNRLNSQAGKPSGLRWRGRSAVVPSLLLLDEPLGPLDILLRRAIGAEIARIAKSLGATVLHVTHDPADAITLADRIAVLEAGRLTCVDRPERLSAATDSEFVRAVFQSGETTSDRGYPCPA